MIDFAIGISGLPVKPDGSKRVCMNLSTSVLSGTPYCNASEIEVAKASLVGVNLQSLRSGSGVLQYLLPVKFL